MTTGVLPFAVTVAAAWGVMSWLRKRLQASPQEMTSAWFAGLTASFLMLTLIGVFFRGEGMALGWPW